ncbi:MAG TPA: EAL domain-containing protein [Peptococcaceae bacterium]|nr:EAL domain-containing protein [Peptococcaceae bacterium]
MENNKWSNDSQNNDNCDLLSIESFHLIVNIISLALVFGSILNMVAQYYILGNDLSSTLDLSVELLVLGCFMQIIMRLKLNPKLKTYSLIVLITILIPLITLEFIEYGSITIWPFPFILIIASLIFIDRTMLFWVGLTVLLTQIIVWLKVPSLEVMLDTTDYLVRLGLFSIGIIAAFYINSLYVKNLKENAYYLQKVQEMAYHDHLTGLPNKLLFNERLKQAIVSAQLSKGSFAVMFLDLDNFKMVNDTKGHEQGDVLLTAIGRRLTAILKEGDTVSRIGGDEFLILAHNASAQGAAEVAQKVINSLNKSFTLEGEKLSITTSIGVALYPVDGETPEALIKNADIAMYQAKEKGKNQFLLCSEVMKTESAENVKLTKDLYRALERDEMLLYYQPQVNNRTGRVVGLEALIRWKHPEAGLVLPDKFIPLAEKTGLINALGEWVLRTACRQIKVWQDKGLLPVRLAVNLSVYQFQNPAIVDLVGEILRDTGLDAKFLELEITESVAMKEKGYIVETLCKFKKLGVSIALDDFGTVYSCLDYIKELPLDRIKIAMPFIRGIAVSEKDEAITKAIIVLARNLGLNTVAEGVETWQQLDFLQRQMCDEIQGYYYYKAMPKEEIEKILQG